MAQEVTVLREALVNEQAWEQAGETSFCVEGMQKNIGG